jgi:O-acetylserine/cysteine efflux transporter
MSIRDFALLVGICLIWASNNVVSRIVIARYGVDPRFYAAARFALVALATAPWLLPAPRPIWRAIVVGLLMGGGNFALLFLGLKTASASSAAIVSQLGLPLTTVLSVLMLGETIRGPRILGIALAFVGVMIVMWSPGDMAASAGLLFIAGSAITGAFGAVMLKQMEGVRPLKLQAWVGLSSVVPMIALSALLEPHGLTGARNAGWVFLAGTAYSALVVSVVAHTLYYGLIQRYEANLIAPLTLMVPLFTIALGVAFAGEAFGPRMAIGTAVALTGVLIIALRKSHVGTVMLWLRERL